jgi:hypothetical protein
MKGRTIPCLYCAKKFADANALGQHAKFKHRIKPDRPRRADDESLADIAIGASLKRSMGEPLDPLEESLLP